MTGLIRFFEDMEDPVSNARQHKFIDIITIAIAAVIQGHLLDDIKEAFAQTPAALQQSKATIETGHGRIEKRSCDIITDTEWICKAHE